MKFSTLDNLRTLDTIEAYSFLKIDFQVQKTFLVKAVIIRGKLTFLVDPFKSSVTVAIRAHYHPLKRPTDGQKGSLGGIPNPSALPRCNPTGPFKQDLSD